MHSSMLFPSRSAGTNNTEEQKHGIFVHYPYIYKVIVHFSRTVLLFFLSVSGRCANTEPTHGRNYQQCRLKIKYYQL